MTNKEYLSHHEQPIVKESCIDFATWLTSIRSIDDHHLFMLLYNKKIEALFEIWLNLERI